LTQRRRRRAPSAPPPPLPHAPHAAWVADIAARPCGDYAADKNIDMFSAHGKYGFFLDALICFSETRPSNC
jgi:hypothetical protein